MIDKVYPKILPRKHDERRGVWFHEYRGAVSALLVQEEVECIKSIVENLYGRDDVSDELGEELDQLQDALIGIAKNGEARMQKLHGVLGAFDLGVEGEYSKPESEKVDWSKCRYQRAPHLELVKDNGHE